MQENRFLKENTLKYKRNRFKQNMIAVEEKYNSYKFMTIKSINNKELYFINFLTSYDCKEYNDLMSICNKLKNDLNEAILLFDGSELIGNLFSRYLSFSNFCATSKNTVEMILKEYIGQSRMQSIVFQIL